MASFTSKFLKKQFVDNKNLEAVADRTSPFVALLEKIERGGASIAEPVILSGPQGHSYSLTAAQAVSAQSDRGASHYEEFNSTFGNYHGSAIISAKAVAGSKTNKEAYLRQVDEVMTSNMKSWTSIAARKLLGPVGGHIGRISNVTIGADGEMSLTIASDALNFAPGQILQAADGTGNGAPSNVRAGLGYVINVYPDGDSNAAHVHIATSESNRVAGTKGIPSEWVNNDYVFRNGDVATATDLSDEVIRSYQGWLTLTAATGTYNGVNRSQDSRLSGFRLTTTEGAGLSVKGKMELLAVKGRKQCGAMDALLYVVGPGVWNELSQECQSFGQLNFEKDLKIGAQMITLITCNGAAQVVADPHCAESDIFLFTKSSLKLYHMDGFPALDTADGNEYLRQSTAAGYEVRWHTFACPTVNGQPHLNGRCDSGLTG